MYIHEGERLYLTKDGGVVPETDPRAHGFLIGPGMELSDADAARYGLTGKQAAEPKPNKRRAGPAENKGA